MNKTEFINAASENAGMKKKDMAKALDAIMETLTDVMKDGDKVTFVGFGTFEVKERAAREGRNPQTGETMTIAACKLPSFKAGKALKDAVNSCKG